MQHHLEIAHRIEFESKLGRDADHEHNAQHGRPDDVLVGSGIAVADHPRPAVVLVHAVDDKGNGDGQQDDPVQLRKWVFVLRKGEYGDRRARENNAQVHPGQKGALVGKEDFGFNLDGRLARFEEGADFTDVALRGLLFATKENGPNAAAASILAVKGIADDLLAAFSLFVQ